ncbi:MAG: hypothetical protein DKT66_05420 [Candidatus Melainabacteria bacterium]|nr:MAG: hypothetical protein DKT66_05420 [Candidatus Melainabacteria bacterium]
MQGLYLVLLPLLINCFLLVILNRAATQAESQIDTSRKQMTVVLKLTHAIYAVTEILLGGSNAMMNGSHRFFSPLINRGWAIVRDDLAQVDKNMPADATHATFQQEISSLLNRQQEIFIKGEDRRMSFDNIFIKMRRINEWVKIGGKESRLLHDEQAAIRDKYLQSLQSQRREITLISQIILVGLVANVLLALFLYRDFHRNLMGRINALSNMAKKLSHNEPLNEVITGSDELREISVELAKVSWRLADIADYRRSLMQMMAHDVRSPLMAADISLATLSKFMSDSLSERGSQNLEEASQALQNCLSLVNDLLLMESFENSEVKLDLKDCKSEDLVSQTLGQASYLGCFQVLNRTESAVLRIDREQISRVLERILRFAASRAPEGSRILVNGTASNDCYQLEVSDQAVPLGDDEASKLFDKLHQAQIAGGSKVHTLGLSIAVPILQRHQGSISYKRIADGNAILLELPLSQSTSTEESTEKPA